MLTTAPETAMALLDPASEGGFRRYFSGYLILRKSKSLFGFLEPRKKHVGEMKNDKGASPQSSLLDEAPTEKFIETLAAVRACDRSAGPAGHFMSSPL
jgi:hypothetical protein